MKFEWKVEQEGVTDIVETLLRNRGISKEERSAFLHPDWDRDTHDPFIFAHMQKAVDRVFAALKKGEKIIIHGDYDADGISGSTLLYTALRDVCEKMNYSFDNVDVFLPDREKDGYGVAKHTIERFVEEGVNLVITVDCGISNHVSLNHGTDNGMDVIICDHHQLGDELPKDALIIHPLAPGEAYPNKVLCGTGVAFKLASALIIHARKEGADFPEGYEKWFLDLVAIATVTDVMPLKGENRVLEKYGLLVLNKTKREGIKKIMDLSRGEMGAIDTQVIGFQIGPRINAAGRISTPRTAFRALAAESAEEARELAGELEQLNRERRRISDAAFRQAHKLAKEKANKHISVIWNEDWMHGVVGLIAGKLVSKMGVPAFVFTKVGDKYVGSGRSIGGLHLVEAMKSCGDIFVKAGGHPQACGLTIESKDLLETFEERVTNFAKEYFGELDLKPTLNIEAEIPLSKVDWDLLETLEKFEPFGEGNRKPLFLSRNLQVVASDRLGEKKNHLRLNVNAKDSEVMKMIGFGFGEFGADLKMGEFVDVVYEIGINEWNGRRELQLKIEDIKKSDTDLENV